MRGKFEAYLWRNPTTTGEKTLGRTRAAVSLDETRQLGAGSRVWFHDLQATRNMVMSALHGAQASLQDPRPDPSEMKDMIRTFRQPTNK
jgi:hypothetical protein